MKKLLAFAGFSLLAIGAFADTNIQVFYDLGSDRKHFTSTLEGYYGDKWGDTFFFVDYDYSTKTMRDEGMHGANASYFEIARGLNFWQNSKLKDLSIHAEFNGGIGFGNNNWLMGVNYLLHNADYSNTFTFEFMYKTFNGGAESDCPLQFTFVWGMQDIFGVKGLRFSGFADLWGEKTSYWYGQDDHFADEANIIFISEPQLWYNIGCLFGCENLHIGTEIELSSNFAGVKGFKCRPCLGAKWVF